MYEFVDPEPENNTPEARAIEHSVMGALVHHYRGYRWIVQANMIGGMVNIYNLDVMAYISQNEPERINMPHAFQLDLNKIQVDFEKAAVMAGGEILERYLMDRSINASPERDNRNNIIT